MKNTLRFLKKLTPMLALAAIMMAPMWGWGQTTVSYSFSQSGAVTGLDEASPGIPLDANIGFGSFKNSGTADPVINGGQLRLYQNATKGGSIKVYASNGVTITQVIVHASGTTGNAAYTVDGGAATNLEGGTTYTMSGLTAISEVEFYVKGTVRVYVDSFEVTYTTGSSGPSITVSLSTLTDFTYIEGSGPSAEQSFTVEGSNLTHDITITPPTNYEISTGTGGAFAATNPILLTQTGGTVANTTIYVRLKTGLTIGSYNGEEIIASSTGADTKTVTCSGSVTIPGAGGGLEDFTNSNASTSYADGSFVGNNGITWTYVASRDGNGDANSSGITLPALMLRRSLDNSAVSSSAISGGIGDFSVKLYKGFTGNGNRQVELFINGVSKGTSTPFNDYDEHIFTVNGIDISGDVVIKITNPTSNQVIVDDISWTGFGTGGNTPPAITNIIQTPSTGINSSSTVSVSADVTDSDGTVEAVALYWGTTSGSLTNNIDMALGSGNTYTTVTDIPAQAGGTTVYYEIYALDDDADETTSPEQSYFVIAGEPTNHVTTFMADVASPAYSSIVVVWDDATGGTVPDGYVIKASDVSYEDIAEPVDGNEEADGTLVKVVAPGVKVANFTGLNPEQTYYFKIWPFTNSGAAIDYKTDGTVPQDEATTAYGIPAAPVATAATDISASGFTANWNAVAGATGYSLDVYTKTAGANATDLFISEYGEGSGGNKKYVEIFNGTGAVVDLADYVIKKAVNGGGWNATVYNFPSSTTLANNSTFVLANNETDVIGADAYDGFCTWNGNDAIGLFKNDVLIDVFGTPDSDPGTGWEIAGIANASVDHILIRKPTVNSPSTDWSVSAGTTAENSQWEVSSFTYDNINQTTNLGSHTMTGGSTQVFVSGYEDLDIGNVVFYNVTGLTPATDYYYVVRATNASGTSGNSNEISVATLASPATSTYTNTGLWTNASNWSNGLPEASTDVIINGNVTVDDFVECNNMTISSTGAVTGGTTAQILYVYGDLLIESDATGTGSLIVTDDNFIVGETTTVQRYLTGGWDDWDAGWHQLSSPVAAQPIADFATTGSGNDYDFYGWSEPTATWMNYKDAGFSAWNGGTNFNVGQGYLVSYEAANSTQTFTGELNTADVTIENMSNGGASFNGWHLLGNPFASALVWNDGNWILNNTAGNAKIWHETNKSYSDIAASGIIPSAQGFMVQVSSATNGVGIPAVSRVHSATPFYKSANAQLLLVAAETEGGSAQESKIMVNPMATEGFDFDFDSRFLAGYAPQLYSVVGDELLSTNSLPELASGKVIPLGFVKNAATAFTIQLKESIPGAVVYLTDIQTGTVTNLTENPVYCFTSNEGDDANRFTLAFGTVGINHPEATAGVQVFAHDDVLYVETPSKEVAQLSVYNLTGQLVLQGRTRGNALSTFNSSALNTGVYVVNILLTDGVVSRKVVINK